MFLTPSARSPRGLPYCLGASIWGALFRGKIVMLRTGLTLGLVLAASIVSLSAAVADSALIREQPKAEPPHSALTIACQAPLVFDPRQNKCVPPPPTPICPAGTKPYMVSGGGLGGIIPQQQCYTFQQWLDNCSSVTS